MRKILILCVTVGVIAVACFLGPKVYRKWRSERAFHNAENALAQNRDKEALLSLQEALQSDPDNLPATRLISKILEKKHSPSSILWHRRLSQLAPGEAEPRLAWFREALNLRDPAMAKAAMESFPEDQRRSALFHHLASSEALLRKDWKSAETHAAEACRIDPESPVLEINLASVHLQSPDPASVLKGREMLVAMQKNDKTGVAATRVLITDALRRRDYGKAADLSRILLPSSSASFGDRLQFLTALEGMNSPETNTELKELQTEAGQDTGKNIQLLDWLLSHKHAKEAQALLQQFSPVLLEDPLIRILRASADAGTEQWQPMTQRLQKENWGENDYLRLAFISRAAKKAHLEGDARNAWISACKAAGQTPQGFYILASTVQPWPDWEDETRELMWMIADGYRYPVWALSHLHNYYLAKGDTRSLLRVAKRWAEVQPSDPVLNNLAQYSLLLDQSLTQATALARENFNRHPDDAAYASTYAFALNQSGKGAEALQIMAGLKPEAWNSPEICAYQAILLSQNKRSSEAEEFRKKAAKASLLPEEKALLEKTAGK